jgi:aminopeptidase N
MRTEEPRAVHLADYQAPDFRIQTVHLDFSLDPEATRIKAKLAILRKKADAPQVLHGEELKLISVAGRQVAHHRQGPRQFRVGNRMRNRARRQHRA